LTPGTARIRAADIGPGAAVVGCRLAVLTVVIFVPGFGGVTRTAGPYNGSMRKASSSVGCSRST
jgi:hypothetical protein